MSKRKDNMDHETREIILSFINEARENLEDIENKLLKINAEYDDELINQIFRMFHSIKGNAACLNFENIKKITHEAESLLDIFRKNKILLEADTVDIIYQTGDCLKQMIDQVETDFHDAGFEAITDQMIDLIKNRMVYISSGKKEDEKVKNEGSALSGSDLITSEIIESYLQESNDIFDHIEKDLLILEQEPDNLEVIKELFRYVHTFKGNTAFIGLAEIEAKIIEIETLLDQARNQKLQINQNIITYLLSAIDLFRKLINTINPATKQISNELLIQVKNLEKITDESGSIKTLGEILVEMGETKPETIEKALQIQQEMKLKFQEKENRKTSIRVDTLKLDKLFELVGELITAGAMISHNPEMERINLNNFKKSVNYFNKITRELQEITMSIRMIPLEGIFNKMGRLVRDLSRKSGKPVNLQVTGEETEMDKNVIEEISDPLVHILRNAIDHGIENRETRTALKKPETGLIRLDARYEGNEIWIIINDDGSGLNKERILKKAAQKGLLKNDPSQMSDKEIWNIIMEPGFSTAQEVSELSGRGVGMDVVRKNIEKLHGKIDISSIENKGTTITLMIPLTLAILDVINVRIGGGLYSISLIDTLEFCKVRPEQITHLEGKKEVFKLRNELIPVIKLYEFYKIKNHKTDLTDDIAIIVQSNYKKGCFLVDEVVGNQQIVIKSLTDYLGEARGLAGCSILGNGEVSLIIDTGKIINDCLKDDYMNIRQK